MINQECFTTEVEFSEKKVSKIQLWKMEQVQETQIKIITIISSAEVKTKCHVSKMELRPLLFSITGIQYVMIVELAVFKSCCEHKPASKNKSCTIKRDSRF